MDEQQSGDARPEPAASAQSAASAPGNPDRTGQIIVGGLLAGFGLSLAAAFVMHVVQQASPIGYAISINGSVLAELFIAGPVFGLGLAAALVAVVRPDSPARAPAVHSTQARPADPSGDG
jgi:hypothetical protein